MNHPALRPCASCWFETASCLNGLQGLKHRKWARSKMTRSEWTGPQLLLCHMGRTYFFLCPLDVKLTGRLKFCSRGQTQAKVLGICKAGNNTCRLNPLQPRCTLCVNKTACRCCLVPCFYCLRTPALLVPLAPLGMSDPWADLGQINEGQRPGSRLGTMGSLPRDCLRQRHNRTNIRIRHHFQDTEASWAVICWASTPVIGPGQFC